MKKIIVTLLLNPLVVTLLYGQNGTANNDQQKSITTLIARYAEAREKRDTVLLKTILTADMDQLVSTGEWRTGISTAVQGILKSSSTNPGTRTLTVDKIRLLNSTTAIADCRYDIQNENKPVRHMWSTFVVALEKNQWKISAIRNMMPVKE